MRTIAHFIPVQSVGSQSTTAVATSSTSVLAASATRKYLLLQNNSDADIYVNLTGQTATVAGGVKVAASGGYWESEAWCPIGAITAIHAGAGSKTLTHLEA